MPWTPGTPPVGPWADRPGPPSDRGNATVIADGTVIAADTVIRITGGPWWTLVTPPIDPWMPL